MRQELLRYLKRITPEEREILNGQSIRRELYTARREFVVDSAMLLKKGKLIEIRPHTRFAHFPAHRHNYVELVYMCAGATTHILDGKERITSMGLLLMNLSRFADSIDRDNPKQREQNMIFSVLQYIETHYRSASLTEISAALRQSDYAISRLLKNILERISRNCFRKENSNRPRICWKTQGFPLT